MTYTNVSDKELLEIKKMLESMLSKSSHGIFFSVGKIIGSSISEEIPAGDDFFAAAAEKLKERNFIDEITFNEKEVSAKGCLEVTESAEATCDILRGIIMALYKKHYGKKLFCEETQCQSTGSMYCIFELREEVI